MYKPVYRFQTLLRQSNFVFYLIDVLEETEDFVASSSDRKKNSEPLMQVLRAINENILYCKYSLQR